MINGNKNDDVILLSPFDRILPHASVCIINAEIHGESYFVLEIFRAEFVCGDGGGNMAVITREIGNARNVGKGGTCP